MPKFTFTSDTLPAKLPARVRAGMWADSMKAIGSSFEMGIVASRTFHGEISVLPLGKVQIGFANTITDGEVNVVRTEELIGTDRDDRIMIVINRSTTTMSVRQFGRQVGLQNGEMAVLAMDIPSKCSTPFSGVSNVVLVPREMVNQPGRIIELYAAKRLEQERGAQLLLSAHIAALLGSEHTLDEAVEASAGEYVISLVRTILALPGSIEPKSKKTQSETRLMSVRKLIARHYREPDFSPDALGRELRISGRSIQNILRANGTTFTAELTRVRLEAAYATLKNSRRPVTISDVALQCGFAELSTFYRAFRRRYGETPKAARAKPN